jgi:hypothetical protein
MKQKSVKQKTLKPGKLLSVAFSLVCATGFASMEHPQGRARNTVSATSPIPGPAAKA